MGRVAESKPGKTWKDLKIPVGTSRLSDGEHYKFLSGTEKGPKKTSS